MKNISIPLLAFAFLSQFVLYSCDPDVLETQPLNEYSEADVWSDPALVELVINGVYNELDLVYREGAKAGLVDESNQTFAGLNFDFTLATPDNIPNRGGSYRSWDQYYVSIRTCNSFFEFADQIEWPEGTKDGKTLRERMTGEVTFLRAALYSYLINYFGGVPLVTEYYDLDDEFQIPRNTYEECVNFIVDELDKAAELLPEVQSGDDDGRATKGAALAWKSRVLLFAASDLYHSTGTLFPGYTHPELIGYAGANRQALWQSAKDAAKEVMDLGVYELFRPDPNPDEVVQNIIDLHTLTRTSEDIFVKYVNPLADARGYGRFSTPNGYGGVSTITPLGDLVDSYEMADGSKFSWDNPDHKASPYENREPRFYANILYEGARFKDRPADAASIDPEGVIQAGVWHRWDEASQSLVEEWGLDTRNSPFAPHNGGYTGYYSRKMVDVSVNQQFEPQTVPWRYIRYSEILLNYAEACIELGEEEEARKYINMIRHRAGLPPISDSGEALRERYRNERRIELSFEDRRFYDVRRWAIAPEAYGEVHGVRIVYELLPDKTTSPTPTITPFVLDDRFWDDRAYFLPIMRSEMNKNSELVQNPGYN